MDDTHNIKNDCFALIDSAGNILSVCHNWRNFISLFEPYLLKNLNSKNYLEFYSKTIEVPHARGILEALRAVLSGKKEELELSYLQEDAYYLRMRISSLAGNGESKFIVFHENITDVQLEREAEKTKLQAIFHNTFEFIGLLDPEGRLVEINRTALEIFSIQREEVIGKEFWLTPWWTPSEELVEKIKFGVEKARKGEFYRTENTHILPDGNLIYVDFSIAPVFDEDGNLIYLLPEGREITEIKKMQNQLKEAQFEAEKSAQAKSEFLANMSHEIRTPLNGILGLAEILLQEAPSSEQLKYLQMIHSSGKNLLGIINDILDYSKIEAGKMELHESIFDIHHALEELVFPYVQLSKKSSLTVSYKIHPDVPRYILGDLLRLKQVLNNFLSNAIKFTEKGYIMLSLKVDEIEGENVVLHFQVKDSGIGLSKKQISNIFTPFIQADSSITKKYGGTGLGLSICKKISDIMGGKIYVDSIPGRGSIFHFIVSLSVRKKIDDFQIIAGLEEDASNLHILLAEDNAVNQAVCKHILNKSGHRVTVVSSGLEAVRLIKEERRFNLILMDISMPDMDGLTALSHIRELEGSRNLYTPVIVLTAYALQGDREKFLELGADDYLSKPYSGEELQRLIRKFSKGVKNFCELDE